MLKVKEKFMKLCSLKNVAIWFAMATMANFSTVFANCDHGCDHHQNHHCDHHKHPCPEPKPPCECPSAEQVRLFEEPGLYGFHAPFRNFTNSVVFQASRNIALDAATALSTVEPNLSFINAELGSNFGGASAEIADLSQVLASLGVSFAAREAFSAAFIEVLNRGILYSDAIVVTPFVPANALDADRNFVTAGQAWANTIIGLCHFTFDEQTTIRNLVGQLIINEEQAIQGYNRFGGLTFITAVGDDFEAHQNLNRIALIVFHCLLREFCDRPVCPCPCGPVL